MLIVIVLLSFNWNPLKGGGVDCNVEFILKNNNGFVENWKDHFVNKPKLVVYESDAYDPEMCRPRTNEPNRCVDAFGFRNQPAKI